MSNRTLTVLHLALPLLIACRDKGTGAESAGPPPGERVASDLGRDTAPSVSEETLAALTQGNRDFATRLYQTVANSNENLFFSPHSISVALAMTLAGARNNTETEMREVLGFSGLEDEDVHAGFNSIELSMLSRAERSTESGLVGFQLSTMNQMWGRKGMEFEDPFLDLLAVNYGAAMYLLDFKEDPAGSREEINDWVALATEGRISSLLPEGSINQNTKLVLANAIYFKAGWATPFNEHKTDDRTFTNLDGTRSTVKMMQESVTGWYAEGDNWELVELPYEDGSFSMALLVPKAGHFSEVEASFDQPFLDSALDDLGTAMVTLSLPRFTIDDGMPLEDPLHTMGMRDAFNRVDADFSGISPDAMDPKDILNLDGVYHKAFLKVDEEGAEAAAATASVGEGEGEGEDFTVTVTIDRPFILMIRDRSSGELLFLGRVLSL